MMATQSEIRMLLKVKDEASRKLEQVNKKLGPLEGGFRGTSKSAGGLAGKFKTLGADAGTLHPALGRVTTMLSGTTGALVAVGLAAGAAAGFIKKATMETALLGEKLVDLSSKTGLSLRALQELGFAGDQVGVNIDIVSSAILRLGRRTAAELPETVKWVEAVGLEVETLKNMDPEDAFRATAKAIGEMKNPAEQAAAAMGIFGDQGLQILPLIRSDIDQTVEKFVEMGGVIEDDVLVAGKELTDHMTNLGAAMRGVKADVADDVIPVLNELFELMEKIVGVDIGEADIITRMIGGVAAPDILRNAAFLLGLLNEKIDDFSEKADELPDTGIIDFLKNFKTETDNVKTSVKDADTSLGDVLITTLDESVLAFQGVIREVESLGSEAFPQMGERFVEVAEIVKPQFQQIEAAARRLNITTRSESAATRDQQIADYQMILASAELTLKQREEAEIALAELRGQLNEEVTLSQLEMGELLLGSTGDLFTQLGEKNKTFAIAGAIINTLLAITKAMTSVPWPANMIQAAGAAVAGFAVVNRIRSADAGGFAQGTQGLDYGSFGGGTPAMLHGNEAIIPQSGANRFASDVASAMQGNSSVVDIRIDASGSIFDAASEDRLASKIGGAVGVAIRDNRGRARTRAIEGINRRA